MQLDEGAIRQYAPQAEELALRYKHTLYQAIVQRAWGVAHRLAGEIPQAEAKLDSALVTFRRLNTPWQIGRTLFELGEVARLIDASGKARQAYTQALAAFEEMGAAPDIARTRAAINSFCSDT